jgi:HEPN domain-containing protein
VAYDRATLQRLAEERLAEARTLLAQGYPSGAYYLAGYAVELALKASIAARFAANEIPDKSFVNAIYTHDLGRLFALASLEDELDASMEASPEFGGRWAVSGRGQSKRAMVFGPSKQPQQCLEAVGAQEDGLLQWLKKRW